MILTMTEKHENLLRDSPLSLLSTVKFFSSLETEMVLKMPNETFLKITRYLLIITGEHSIYEYMINSCCCCFSFHFPQLSLNRHVHNLKSTVYVVSGQVKGKTLLPLPVGTEQIEEGLEALKK